MKTVKTEKNSVQHIDIMFIAYYDTIQIMDSSEEIRWLVVKALLDNFPDIRKHVREYLQEEKG
jgi:hypothetical protein